MFIDTNQSRLTGWRGFRAQLPYIPRALRLVWEAARVYTALWLVLLIVQSIIPVIVIVLTRDAVNSIVTLVQSQWNQTALMSTIGAFALVAIVQVASELIDSLTGFVRTAQSERIRDDISHRIQEKSVQLDLRYFETQAFYDLIHRVRLDARMRPLSLLENVGMLIRTVLSLVGMIGLLISYSPLLPVILLAGGLPALWSVVRFSRKLNQWRLGVSVLERRSTYYDTLLTEQSSAQEVRLFALAEHYRRLYTDVRSTLREQRLSLARGKILSDLLATAVGLVLVAGALLWMGWRAVTGSASLGDLAAFYQIFRQGQGLFLSLMGSAGEIYQNVLFLEDLFAFFDLPPYLPEAETQGAHSVIPLRHAIEIQNISFSYPGSTRSALQNFSLTIPAGKIIALVGENGQGKTTLVKLLCRFYDPDGGRILWDGVDIRDLPLGDLRRSISMLFQVPIRYMETARQNIAIGDLRSEPTDDAIRAAAESSAAEDVVAELPDGYGTMLGKWFGGEELSVGQWQRLALARAFLRDAPLIILDEPTSAMDSWAENDWLERVRDHAAGRTLIMITHRFTTAMLADRIYLLQNNRIIEEGTHADLLALDGVYADSWHEQMKRAEESPVTAAGEPSKQA